MLSALWYNNYNWFFFFIMFSLNMFPPWNWRKVVLTLNSTSQVWRKNLGKKQIGALYMVSIVCITFFYSFLLYKLLRFFFCFTLLLVVTRFFVRSHNLELCNSGFDVNTLYTIQRWIFSCCLLLAPNRFWLYNLSIGFLFLACSMSCLWYLVGKRVWKSSTL